MDRSNEQVDPGPEGGAWESALRRLADSGEEVGALLARAARNLAYWKGREAPFPSEALSESERDFRRT